MKEEYSLKYKNRRILFGKEVAEIFCLENIEEEGD